MLFRSAEAPDLDDASRLLGFAAALREARRAGLVLAYHDRSDGGLAATLAEMAFAGHCGLDISLPASAPLLPQLFSEELGAVLQVRAADAARVRSIFAAQGLADAVVDIGRPTSSMAVSIRCGDQCVQAGWSELRQAWSETSHRMRLLRDDPDSAQIGRAHV